MIDLIYLYLLLLSIFSLGILGSPRLLFDFGSGTQEISFTDESSRLNDGDWHQLDIYFDSNIVRLVVDNCVRSAIDPECQFQDDRSDQNRYHQTESFSSFSFDQQWDTMRCFKQCQNYSKIIKFHHCLNVNAPLQLGGIFELATGANSEKKVNKIIKVLEKNLFNSNERIRLDHRQQNLGFTGCIRNLIYNNQVYDLINVHYSYNAQIGCHSGSYLLSDHTQSLTVPSTIFSPQSYHFFFSPSVAKSLCSFLDLKCYNGGYCDGSYNQIRCECNQGFYGPNCQQPFRPVMFRSDSFLQLSIPLNQSSSRFDQTIDWYRNVPNDGFITIIEFYFRTRKRHGLLIKLIGLNNRTYCLMEIYEGHLRFRFNLNPTGYIEEYRFSIESNRIDDGQWHHIRAERFGTSGQLILDHGTGGGGLGRLIRTINFKSFDKKVKFKLEHRQRRKQREKNFILFLMDYERIMLGGDLNHSIIDHDGIRTISTDSKKVKNNFDSTRNDDDDDDFADGKLFFPFSVFVPSFAYISFFFEVVFIVIFFSQ